MREIKFRAWDKLGEQMFPDHVVEGRMGSLPSTWKVMQFTGLHDKNGKEIYEGDVVKVRGLKEPQIVGFDIGWACYCFIYDTGEMMRRITSREIIKMEVIGNIYENPELLKRD